MEMIDEWVFFKGFRYPVRTINVNGKELRISVISLEDKLMYSTGAYVSKYAELIDYDIYYYVDDDEIKLTDDELTELVVRESGLDEDENG